MLGGEIVMITMGAIGVEKGWPYVVFGGLGAVGGGVGGFFIEDATADEKRGGWVRGMGRIEDDRVVILLDVPALATQVLL